MDELLKIFKSENSVLISHVYAIAKEMYEIGYLYYEGKGVEQDFAAALKWYERAYSLGELDAAYYIALIYYEGKGVKQDFVKARHFFENPTYIEAKYYLGLIYENGQGVEKDLKKAFKFFESAANCGIDDAQYKVGMMYYNGKGVEQNFANAAYWLEKCNKSIDADVAYGIGKFLYSEKNFEKARDLYKKAADLGNVNAMLKLGEMYRNGLGAHVNLRIAKIWYEKAADLGNAEAIHALAAIYSELKDYYAAAKWSRKSADLGNSDAMHNLAIFYHYGWGVKTDFEKAVEWYEKAALAGNKDAANKLGSMYYFGDEIKRNLAKAVEWFTKSAELGNSFSMYNLALMYFDGEGVEKSVRKALHWLKKSAELKNLEAVKKLVEIYSEGKAVKQNFEKTAYWLEKAIELDDDDKYSMYQLGMLYYEGKGVERNFETAAELLRKNRQMIRSDVAYNLGEYFSEKKNGIESVFWYEKAADKNHAGAMYKLGMIYYYNSGLRGVHQSFVTSAKWFEKAANLGNVESMKIIFDMYRTGTGVSRDTVKAAEFAIKLGKIYSEGKGVEKNFDEAVKWYERAKADDSGNLKAKNFLDAVSLEDCMRFAKDYYAQKIWRRSFEWYERAAKYDDAEAMYHLAEMYFYGRGVTENLKESLTYCQKSASKGYSDAVKFLEHIEEESSVQIADDYFNEYDFNQAFEWYEKAAKRGNKYSLKMLAYLYENGWGVNQDFEKAAELYTASDNPDEAFRAYSKVADSGNVNAMLKLAEICREKSNFADAFDWYTKAAELDNAEAIYNLGTLYYSGLGVTQNFDKALELYDRAAKLGYEEAIESFAYFDAEVVIKMAEKYRKQDNLEKAIELYEIAANAGNEDAENIYFELNAEKFIKMADEYFSNGDFEKAVEFYEKAADFGSARAMVKLGEIYFYGRGGVQRNQLKSLDWYEKAAEAGDQEAKKFLSRIDSKKVVAIADDFFAKKNFAEAVKWYTKAANLNNTAAMYKLAEMYESGQGVEKSIEKAFGWLRKATVAERLRR